MGSGGGGEVWAGRGVYGVLGRGEEGVWAQTDMFRFKLNRAGSVTERERERGRERGEGG